MLRHVPLPVLLIWVSLAAAGAVALTLGHWPLAFVAAATLALTLVPLVVTRRIGVRLPVSFVIGSTLFVYATLFLGEALDFYTRFWWWDLAMHGGAALGFGIVGFVFAFLLFEGERYAAPPWALALLGFTVAVTIGTLWELFEWVVDLSFGTNMLKSGLPDTMGDLVLNMAGGAAGAVWGYLHLKRAGFHGFGRIVGRYIARRRLRVPRD